MGNDMATPTANKTHRRKYQPMATRPDESLPVTLLLSTLLLVVLIIIVCEV